MTRMKHYLHFKSNMRGTIPSALGVASMVFVLPAAAIEKPEAIQADEEIQSQAQVLGKSRLLNPEVIRPQRARPQMIQPDQIQFKKIALLGVGGSPVSDTLAKHLKLKHGRGLVINHVAPDSSASEAGLKPRDILTNFNGKQIGLPKLAASSGDAMSAW